MLVRGLVGAVEAGRWAGLGDQRSVETRHSLPSAPLDAATSDQIARRHWGIEHRLHWVLAVTRNEGTSRIRAGHAARNLAALRRHALNLLRRDATRAGSVATKRFRAALDQDYLATLMADTPTPASPSTTEDAFALPSD